MAKKKQTEYLAHEVIAIAFACFRINEGYVKETRRFSTEGMATLFSNKEMIGMKLEHTRPDDYNDFEVTDEDYNYAKISVDWLHKDNALGIIGGTLNEKHSKGVCFKGAEGSCSGASNRATCSCSR